MATSLENYVLLLRKTHRNAEAVEIEAHAKAIRDKHASENRGESSSRVDASDRPASGSPPDSHPQRPAPSDVIRAPRAVPPELPRRVVPGSFTVGSSKDKVLAVQGTPTEFSDRVWKYGSSTVFFSSERVKGWDVWPDSPLKVLLQSAKDRYAGEGLHGRHGLAGVEKQVNVL